MTSKSDKDKFKEEYKKEVVNHAENFRERGHQQRDMDLIAGSEYCFGTAHALDWALSTFDELWEEHMED